MGESEPVSEWCSVIVVVQLLLQNRSEWRASACCVSIYKEVPLSGRKQSSSSQKPTDKTTSLQPRERTHTHAHARTHTVLGPRFNVF